MKKKLIQNSRRISREFRVTKGKNFRLKDIDPGDTLQFTWKEDKARAKEALANGVLALAEMQDKLYAQDRWALLLVFQAMDAAGKDGAIKHVMSGVNPQGCQVSYVQGAIIGRSRPRFFVALHQGDAESRQHRHFQPQLL